MVPAHHYITILRWFLLIDVYLCVSSLLKIWNMNKYGGVLGAFNCQGAGWCKLDKKYMIHNSTPDAVSGSIRATDIEGLADVATQDWKGDCVVLRHRTRELIQLPRNAPMPITLQKLEYEIFTVVPLEVNIL